MTRDDRTVCPECGARCASIRDVRQHRITAHGASAAGRPAGAGVGGPRIALACGECSFVVDAGEVAMEMGRHTIVEHERLPTRAERTPGGVDSGWDR